MSKPRSWGFVPEQARKDLLRWFNVCELDVDAEDRARLARLYFAGHFHAWNCPDCGDRVYWGNPSDWSYFQGVRQADCTSYPGDTNRHTLRHIAQQCDDCRQMTPATPDLDVVGDGEPSCWPPAKIAQELDT